MGNRNWTKREGNVGDVFDYDNNDQVTVVKLNIANPDTTAPGSQTIHYDTNGNRTSFAPYGTTDNYTTNNLNEYTVRNSISAAYNASADMTTGFDGSTYTYDAQNRLLSATESGVTETFDYDGLNRQVSRTVAGVTTYNVYDGWALIEEYQSGGMTAAYLHGAGGLVKDLTTNNYYYQDASRSTSHLADSAGNLLEWYRYDLQGTPVFYNFANTQQSASAYGVRHLFTGQQWYSELGLYNLRNRFYSPDIGRFVQPDPIGFWGDRSNLYRYCGNNPVTKRDPSGLGIWKWLMDLSGISTPGSPSGGGGTTATAQPVIVTSTPIGDNPGNPGINRIIVGNPFGFGPGGFVPTMGSDNPADHRDYNPFPRPPEDNQPSVQQPPASNVPLPSDDPNTSSSLSLVPLPTLSDTTYFVGVSLAGIPIVGTIQFGMYTNSGLTGVFASPGNANQKYSIDITGGFVAGYVVGPVQNFRGRFLNSTFGLGPYGASALHNASGQTVGYSGFYGLGFPITVAGTATYTSISEPAQLYLIDPWPLGY